MEKEKKCFNKIQKEKELSMKYQLEKENDGLVALTEENVAKVEFMLMIDSSYRKAFDKEANPKGNYKGSSAYWFSQLLALVNSSEKSKGEFCYEDIIKEIVNAIDRENSTRLTTDGVGREELSKRLLSIESLDKMLEMLKAVDEMPLYDLLSAETHPTDTEKYRSRKNPSFASKFCHYACFYLFEGSEEQDNYSIYDNVIRKILPKYAEKYNVKDKEADLTDYRKYQMVIGEIIDASGAQISRNGFDHLLWYYHKGN